MNITTIKEKLLQSKLFKDSFWAVFGNGFGNALLLLAGVLIARFLGKDVYGEYGVVKTTMFYVASFATFGLGFTSTKYIAQHIESHSEFLRSIIYDSIKITLSFSSLIAVILIAFAESLSEYVSEPSLKIAFQALAGIIICKALTTTQVGILSGFKEFKETGRNGILSGIFMLVLSVPLTFFYGLKGSLLSLFLSQLFNATINHISIRKKTRNLKNQVRKSFVKELLKFSLPVALQESSFTVCNWAAILFLTKYSSTGELGLYSASAQWCAIISMIPSLLSNVVLSYLSGSISNKSNHSYLLKRMLIVNFACALLPLLIVIIFANVIAFFYGPTFTAMPDVIRVLSLGTIFESIASVLKSELMANGRTWELFFVRLAKDVLLVTLAYFILRSVEGLNGAMLFSIISSSATLFLLIFTYIVYSHIINKTLN